MSVLDTIYGIDLGTTYSLISEYEGYTSPLVPSVVDFITREVGDSVKDNFEESTLRSYKRSISKVNKPSIAASYLVLDKLRKMMLEHKSLPLDTIIKAVISVPAKFNAEQRECTLIAAKKAKIDVQKLINEPTAAALHLSGSETTSVVYDLGGGTCDITITKASDGKLTTLATVGLLKGGDDLDLALRDFLWNKYSVRFFTLDESSKLKWKEYARKLKHKMQDINIKEASVSVLGNIISLTAKEYKDCVMATFLDTFTLLKNTIEQVGLKPKEYKLIPVGGSTHCPILRQILEDVTGTKCEEQVYNPDEAVVKGDAYFAHALQNGTALNLIQIEAPSIYVKINNQFIKLISDGSPLPASGVIAVNPTFDTQTKVSFEVYAGDKTTLLQKIEYDFKERPIKFESILIIKCTVMYDGIPQILCYGLDRPGKCVKLC